MGELEYIYELEEKWYCVFEREGERLRLLDELEEEEAESCEMVRVEVREVRGQSVVVNGIERKKGEGQRDYCEGEELNNESWFGVVEVEELKGEKSVGMKLVEEVRWVVAGDDRDLIERVGKEVSGFDVRDRIRRQHPTIPHLPKFDSVPKSLLSSHHNPNYTQTISKVYPYAIQRHHRNHLLLSKLLQNIQ